jgi:hypothetical protein
MSDSRRASKVLALAALAFLCGQLAAGLALDRAPLGVRFPEAEAVLARARAARPQRVFLGSSRMQAAFADESFPPGSESLAVKGGDVVSSAFLLDRLLAEGVRPVWVGIELSPELLRYPPPFLNAQLVRQFRWGDVIHWLPEIWTGGAWPTCVRARLLPVYHYRRELLTWITGREPPYLVAPYAVTPARHRGHDDPQQGAHRWQQRLRGYARSPRAEAELERLLSRCRSEGIQCSLIELPVSSAHRALYGPEIQAPYESLLHRLESEYGVDYRNLRDFAPDTDFRDSSHLSERGQAPLLERLGHTLL